MNLPKALSRVLIGIQARSTSERLPNKAYELIGEKRMLDHVIDAAWKSAKYTNQYSKSMGIRAEIAVLTPSGDTIAQDFKNRCQIIEGPEHDVLGRYLIATNKFGADYVARITGDCPMIPPWLISKHIKLAVVNGYDYVSNVEEGARTAADGFDCEVISARLLKHIGEAATATSDREHVTTLARRERPPWARMGFVVGFSDDSLKKLSVDTIEDLERVRIEFDRIQSKYSIAAKTYGKQAVHKI